MYMQLFPGKPEDRFFPISYGSALRWLKRLADLLGAGALKLTTHTLRRSGASELSRQAVPLADILNFGRWLSERSAREYIRRGEVAVLRGRQSLGENFFDKLNVFRSRSSQVWELYVVLHVKGRLDLSLERITDEVFRKFVKLLSSM
jgi:hypothetical protein